ncbi:hypothetical protein ACFWFK_31360 [Micromonospora chalcea]
MDPQTSSSPRATHCTAEDSSLVLGSPPTQRLDAEESIKALSAYLGHADPGFTLRTYTHLLPTSEDRTRRAIDKALGEDQEDDDPSEAADGLETA